MLHIYTYLIRKQVLLLFLLFFSASVIAQITYIPDSNFEQALIDLGIDSDGVINGQVLTADIEGVTVLNVRNKNISDLSGIEDFAALEELDITGNFMTSLNIFNNSQLKRFTCISVPINEIDLSGNLQLEQLVFRVRSINEIDLSTNLNLEILDIRSCGIPSIDLSNNINLKRLDAASSYISAIDLSNNINLEYLDVFGVRLTEIDVSQNILLKEFYCGNEGGVDWQEITEIDLSNNENLEVFYSENLFYVENFNAKNGNNSILDVNLSCEHEGYPCSLNYLTCIEVDDAEAANNGEFPYNTWFVSADFYYSEDCSLGVSTPKENGFMLSENPVHQNLILAAPGFSSNVKLEIYSIQGKLLKNESLYVDNQTSIDVSQLAAGVYVLKIINNTYGVTTKRFIKR